LCNFLRCPIISSSLGPNIFLSTLFSDIINLCSSLYVKGQVSHLYKRTQAEWHLHTTVLQNI
jgi:hypothetical protein